ncbi:MAG: hypothetical protein JO001_06205 [Alphaproteobacteria bacterium]|nr:hypothetical protein [Alphaproteobacteria bacterium]
MRERHLRLLPGSSGTLDLGLSAASHCRLVFLLSHTKNLGSLAHLPSSAFGFAYYDMHTRLQAAHPFAVRFRGSRVSLRCRPPFVSWQDVGRLIDAEGDDNIRLARENAQQAWDTAGGNLPRDVQGALMRDQLEAAKSATKATEGRLWQAIDPDGSLTIGTTPTSQAAAQITRGIPSTAKPPTGEEAEVFDLARNLPPTASFQDFAALRGRLLDAIRDERQSGQTPALRRMQQLRQAMDDTMSSSAQDVADEQATAVAAGAMSPDDTLTARMAAKAQGYLEDRNIQAPAALQRLAAGGESPGGNGSSSNVTGGSGRIYSAAGGGSTSGGEHGVSPGNPGVQGQAPLAPTNFDADAAARYREAADATRNRAQTFNTGATGQVLQSGPAGTPYRVPDSAVAEKFISSPEGVQSFLAAGGRPETLQDALVSDLRAYPGAVKPDGTLNPQKLQAWQGKRADALRAFPDLQQRLSDAGAAQSEVDNQVASKAADLADFQRSAAGRFLAGTTPRRPLGRSSSRGPPLCRAWFPASRAARRAIIRLPMHWRASNRPSSIIWSAPW